ncbi:MAG: hypothetical protein Q8Q88_06635 [Phenylobacterium sp.]|uniref:hypothetical protein n=1 Tax=Phenylobacterium sp. TaxID=1871053 RepID=UPI0027375968|nr:hypothetical protein [Phenylobacterium sp.]MDP3746711.1 hypothetical protein [Phenylobacterium sp.]
MPGHLPFELAVLFAVPITEAAFLSAASGTPRSDYVGGLVGRRKPSEAWAGEDGYHRVAEAAQRLAALTEHLGGRVVTDAGLADLRRATETSDVVILCGHWRGAPLAEADLRGSVHDMDGAVQAAAGPEGEILRAALTALPRAPVAEQAQRAWRREFAGTLNRLILAGAFNNALKLSDPREREAIGPSLARAVIDEVLGPHIAPGNRLELADGLVGEAEIEAAIAPNFAGELDLSVCQSVYLARFLGKRRAEHVPRPIFHHGLNHLVPISRFAVLADTLKACEEASVRYHEARALVEAALMSAFGKIDGNQRGGTPWAWARSWIGTMCRATSLGSEIGKLSRWS